MPLRPLLDAEEDDDTPERPQRGDFLRGEDANGVLEDDGEENEGEEDGGADLGVRGEGE